jgi:hypothetical protein
MSALSYVAKTVIPAAFSLLPSHMRASPEIAPMLLAIGLQESRFEYRFQIGGPAHGFWQSEYGGGAWTGILTHYATRELARSILQQMAYGEPDVGDYKGIAHNDVLACLFARLLLWTHPKRLPGPGQTDYAWQYYLDTWRPGRPHPETWPLLWGQAWEEVKKA